MQSPGHNATAAVTAASLLYNPLSRESREIRLITFESLEEEPELKLRLHVFSLQGAPKYKAVSYVWGSPSNTKPISVNDATVHATMNLHDALLEIRASLHKSHADDGAAYLWVDALCINQDAAEKNHQVAMMQEIYPEAEEVLMWVRFDSTKADTVFTLLEDWALAIHIIARASADKDDPIADLLRLALQAVATTTERDPFETSRVNLLAEFVHNEYWKRIWILQEVVLATRGRILAGSRSFSLDMFSVIWISMCDISLVKSAAEEQRQALTSVTAEAVHVEVRGLAQMKRLRHSAPSATDSESEGLCGRMLKLWRPELSADSYSDISGLLEQTQDFSATDPRDRIFALQSLLPEDRRVLAPDYGLAEAEVYTRATISEIERTGTLRPISWSGIGFNPNEPRLVGLPSWAPNLSDKKNKRQIFTCEAGGDFPLTPQISRVDTTAILRHKGVVCGKLRKVRAVEVDSVLRWDSLIWKWVEFMHVNWGEMRNMPRISSTSWVKTLFQCLFSDQGIPFSGNIFRYFVVSMISRAELDDRSLTWLLRTSIRPSPGFEQVILSARVALMRNESLLSPLGTILEAGLRNDGDLEEDKTPGYQWNKVSGIWNERDMVNNSCGIVLQQGLGSIFFSDNGFVGLAPSGAQEGDSICILLGHPTPFIIRPKGDDWELVGWARIPGMMHGEMIEGLEASEGEFNQESSKVETISLV